MELNERSAQILKAAVQGFIDSGEPVSSGWLYRSYDFGIKPAMIRIELEELTDEGYLTQPHHSAGRVPTDKGYEFFADYLLGDTEAPAPGQLERSLKNLFVHGSWPRMLETMTAELGLLGVLTDFHTTYKQGIDALISNMEWQTKEEVESVIKDFVDIDKRMEDAGKKLEDENAPSVFIGKKSPVTKSENLAVVMGRYNADGEEVLLVGIGPKRMNYRKIIKVFKNI